MQDTRSFNDMPGPGPLPHSSNCWTEPSSSRMLTTYLDDVEQMLDEGRWDAALRDASELPRIAVALTDPQLRSSNQRCKAWCDEWVRREDPTAECGAAGAEHESAYSEDAVPSSALRSLRLRRHARNPPRGFRSARTSTDGADATNALEFCTALVEGVRRWYAHSACHNATAQSNLARLAVLR
jgi:hypothetical protein